jgi:hypothetical protein
MIIQRQSRLNSLLQHKQGKETTFFCELMHSFQYFHMQKTLGHSTIAFMSPCTLVKEYDVYKNQTSNYLKE